MTTRRLFGLGTAAAAAALLVMTQDASAFGKKRGRGCDAPSCEPACAAAAPCATAVSYVDQQVTCYKTEWKTKKVDVDVVEHNWVDQKYKYTVCVPTATKEKVKVTECVATQQKYTYTVNETVAVKEKVKVCELVASKQAFKYTVNEVVAVKEKVKVCETKWTEQEQKYTYHEPVYGKTTVMRTVCETVCVPTQVACAPPAPSCDSGGRKGLFSRLCKKPSCDPCPTACASPCADACAPCTKTVMVRQVISKQVPVEVTTCTMVAKEGTRKVNVATPVWTEREVTVHRCVPVEKAGERVVHTPTWVEREVVVHRCVPAQKEGVRTVLVPTVVEREVVVTRMVPTEKEGTRKVCVPTTVRRTVDVSYCERVAYVTTIKVPVAAPCAPAPVCCH